MSTNLDVSLFVSETFTIGNANLFTNNVNAGDELSDRMFDLNTGVHFNKIELTVFVQEFKRAGAAIA